MLVPHVHVYVARVYVRGYDVHVLVPHVSMPLIVLKLAHTSSQNALYSFALGSVVGAAPLGTWFCAHVQLPKYCAVKGDVRNFLETFQFLFQLFDVTYVCTFRA